METSELSDRIYDIVVKEVEALYPIFMKRVNNIDLDYFEDITRDSEELPEELNFELRDRVLDDVKQYAIQLLNKSNIKRRIDTILFDVDTDIADNVLGQVRELLRSYVYVSSILNGSSDVTEEELQEMYIQAKKRDLWERITRNNKGDILRFHHALMDKTYEQCKDVLYGSIESILGTIKINRMETKDCATEDKKDREEQTYHCNDCGNTIYKHEVFCSRCGKLLDKYDFED